jgi:hypothetical protein
MPSVPVITINQSGKPAGVAGQARDDLSIYSGAGTEVLLADSGSGSTRTWQLLDQPKGAAAVIDAPDQPSISISGATIPGSYMIQLTVDGGTLPGQIVRLIFAVQIDLPSWVGGANLQKFRIPAAGETIEFNRLSSPAAGPNARGWADEMNDFLGVVARNAFGTLIKDNGSAVGAEAFRTINFVGSTIVDAGNGEISITATGGGGGSLNLQNFNAPIGAFNTINAVPAALAASDVAGPGNAQFKDIGTGHAALIVTNTEHIRDSHTSHIVAINPAVGALVPNLNPGGTPHWTFAALQSDQLAITDGKTMDASAIGSNPTYQNPPTNDKALYDLVLAYDGTIALATRGICFTPTVNAVVFDIDPAAPPGTYSLQTRTAPNTVSWGGGPEAPITSGSIVRCYASNGTWADIKIGVSAITDATESWNAAGNDPTDQRLPLARAPYWTPPSAPIQWGFATDGPAGQFFSDRRPFGAVGASNFDHSAIEKIEESARDTRRSGVVFSHRGAGNGLPMRAGGAELDLITTPLAGGSNLHLSARGIFGGDFWINGKRVTVHGPRAFDGFLPVLTEVIVYLELGPTGPQYQSFDVTAAGISLVTALRQLMHSAGPGQILPLYTGQTDDSSNLLARDRLDLRRDVAHLGENTVASRELVLQMLDPSVITRRASTGDVAHHDFVLSAEYESIGAALLWYTMQQQTNGSTGSTQGEIIGSSGEAQPLGLRIIGDTYESRKIVLWQNITIEGVGDPVISLPSTIPDPFCIGEAAHPPYAANVIVRNVHLKGLHFVGEDACTTAEGTNGGILRIVAPQLDPTLLDGFTVDASLVNVSVEDCTFDYLSRTGIGNADLFAGILVIAAAAVTLPLVSGQIDGLRFSRIKMRTNRTQPGNGLTVEAYPTSNLNAGIAFQLQRLAAPETLGNRNILIEDCELITRHSGLVFTSSEIRYLTVRGNVIIVNAPRSSEEYLRGIDMQTEISRTTFENNRIEVHGAKPTCFYNNQYNELMQFVGNSLLAKGGTLSTDDEIGMYFPYANSLSLLGAARISQNTITARHGIHSIAIMDAVDIFDNIIGHDNSGITISPESTNVGILLIPHDDQSGILRIHRNTITSRIGILLDLPDSFQSVDIIGNSIFGEQQDDADTVKPGSGFGRGIYLALADSAMDRKLVIRDNRICRFSARCDTESPYITGVVATGYRAGLTVAIKTTSTIRTIVGVVIEGNDIDPGSDISNAPTFKDTVGALFGIQCIGAFDMLTIRNNTVINTAFRTVSEQAAIDLNDFVLNINGRGGPLIEGNRITWISACRDFSVTTLTQPETKNNAAAIRLRGHYPFPIICRNQIQIQSVQNSTVGLYGYIHGVLAQSIANADIDGVRIDDNTIETTFVGITGDIGVIGSAIIVHAPYQHEITQGSVSRNKIFGEFNLGVDPTSINANGNHVAVVSIAAATDQGLSRFAVDGNIVNATDFTGSGLGGSLHFSGIRIGSADGPGSGGMIVTLLSVQNNVVSVTTRTDSPYYTARFAGAIALVTQANPTALPPLPGGSRQALVQGNVINRVDNTPAAPGPIVVRGILNHGFQQSVFANNVVDHVPNTQADIDDSFGLGTPSNLWNGNSFGSHGQPGTAVLTVNYVPIGSGTNWSGTAFV